MQLAAQLQLLHHKTQDLLHQSQRERDDLTRSLEETEKERARQAEREREKREAAQAALAAAERQGAAEKQRRQSAEAAAAAQKESARELEGKLAASMTEQGALLEQLQEAQHMLRCAESEVADRLMLEQHSRVLASALHAAYASCCEVQASLDEAGRRAAGTREQQRSAAAWAGLARRGIEEQVAKLREEASAEGEALRARASVAEGSKAELEGKVRELEESNMALEEERRTLIGRWQSLQEHVEAAVAERKHLKDSAADLEASLSGVRQELEEANSAVASAVAERQAVAADLLAAKEAALTFEAQATKTEEAFLMQIRRAHDERDAAMTERDAALLERNAARADADAQHADREAAEALNVKLTAQEARLRHDASAAAAQLSERAAELELALSAQAARADELEQQLASGRGGKAAPVLVDGDTQTMTVETVDLTSGETWRKLEQRELEVQEGEAQLKEAREQLKEARDRIQVLAAAAAERESRKAEVEEAGPGKGACGADGGGADEEGSGTQRVWQEQQADLRQQLRAKDEEVEELRRQVAALETKARAAGDLEVQMERLKQQFNIKHKEQLEKTAQQRVKIAEEMRSAFRELQKRNERLDISQKLLAALDRQVGILTQELEANNIALSSSTRAQLAQISQDETGLRAQMGVSSLSAHDAHAFATAGSKGGLVAASPAPAGAISSQGVGAACSVVARAPARGVLKRSSAPGECATTSAALLPNAPHLSDSKKMEGSSGRRVAFVGIPDGRETEEAPEDALCAPATSMPPDGVQQAALNASTKLSQNASSAAQPMPRAAIRPMGAPVGSHPRSSTSSGPAAAAARPSTNKPSAPRAVLSRKHAPGIATFTLGR